MASDQVPYHHPKTKSDEPSEAAVDTATNRGLFGFAGKKEEEKKCEGEVIADEFDKKVEVSEEKEETKKHGSLLEKLQRSNSSSSSSSEEEVEENGEKKKKKKDKIGKGEDTNIAVDKAGDEEKKGFLEKIKEKLPGGKKAEDVASPPPTPAPAAAPAQPATSPGAEKKGLLDKIKEKIPGHSKTDEEKEDEKENQCK